MIASMVRRRSWCSVLCGGRHASMSGASTSHCASVRTCGLLSSIIPGRWGNTQGLTGPSFHRVLRDHGQMRRRGRARPPRSAGPPSTHVATAPGQVWCWDVTFLPARVQGRWFYLFLILDLYSRKIVGHEVHDTDQAE